MDQRALKVLVGSAAVFAFAAIITLVLSNAAPGPASSSATASSTNSQAADDLSSQISSETSQLPGLVTPPAPTIYGRDILANYLNADQVDAVTQSLGNFVMAHAGLSTTTAILASGSTQSGSALDLRLTTNNPEVVYKVSIDASGSNAANPLVSFERMQ